MKRRNMNNKKKQTRKKGCAAWFLGLQEEKGDKEVEGKGRSKWRVRRGREGEVGVRIIKEEYDQQEEEEKVDMLRCGGWTVRRRRRRRRSRRDRSPQRGGERRY